MSTAFLSTGKNAQKAWNPAFGLNREDLSLLSGVQQISATQSEGQFEAETYYRAYVFQFAAGPTI